MKIGSINNNFCFGKKAILSCKIKKADTKEAQSATLYQYDKNNPNDVGEILNSNLPVYYAADFASCGHDFSKYYALKVDDSDEFASFAKVSRHYSMNGSKYDGFNTVIDQVESNPDFIDAELPLLSEIASEAYNSDDAFILTSFRADNAPYMKKSSFSETKEGNWVIPQRRFVNLIDRAEKINSIEYLS